MTSTRVEQVKNDPGAVARVSGFWNAFLGLSDYLLLDVPLLNEEGNTTLFRINHRYKQQCTALSAKEVIFSDIVSHIPNSVKEDDVDYAIHMLFNSLPSNKCFEGLCNPPEGIGVVSLLLLINVNIVGYRCHELVVNYGKDQIMYCNFTPMNHSIFCQLI